MGLRLTRVFIWKNSPSYFSFKQFSRTAAAVLLHFGTPTAFHFLSQRYGRTDASKLRFQQLNIMFSNQAPGQTNSVDQY